MTNSIPRFALLSLLAFFTMALGGEALAAPQGRQISDDMRERMKDRFDENKDGKLDEKEQKAMDEFIKEMQDRRRGGRRRGGGMRLRNEKLTAKFDEDKDGVLNVEERKKARAHLKKTRGDNRNRRWGRRGGAEEPAAEKEIKPGKPIKPDDVKHYPYSEVYDTTVMRTIFFEFPQEDWFEELSAFHRTDIEVPAKMIVDGVSYPAVGVRFRGNTSFMMVRGKKRSMNISIDYDGKSDWKGYRTLNLLNAHTDPSFMREILFSNISRQYVVAPQANFVNVVINGQNHGVYVNVQQVNKDLIKQHLPSSKGYRWKIAPNFAGDGGVRYLGDDIKKYKAAYELKAGKEDKAWPALIKACKILAETPDDKVEEVLPKHFAVHEILWHLALDNVFQDDDGYFSRASDYQLFCDKDGRFHLITHDNNETFRPAGRGPGGGRRGGGRRGRFGPPGGGPPGGGPPPGGDRPPRRPGSDAAPGGSNAAPGSGVRPPRPERAERGGQDRNRQDRRARGQGGQDRGRRGRGGQDRPQPKPFGRDPLWFANEDPKQRPLIARLLSVPAWRARYLAHVKHLTETELAWERLAKRIEPLHALVSPAIKEDQHTLYGQSAFDGSVNGGDAAPTGRSVPLKAFAEGRFEFLSNHAALKGDWPTVSQVTQKAVPAGKDRAAIKVRAKIESKAKVDRVLLWSARGGRDFESTVMYDDGQHDDGEAGDGIYGGTTQSRKAGKKLSFYVEALALGKMPRAAYWPLQGETKPVVQRMGDD